jgi:type I restriction enzyme R subunit
MGGKNADSDIPVLLHGKPEAIAVYNNLAEPLPSPAAENKIAEPECSFGDSRLALAMTIDRSMREQAPAGWKGDETKERVVLNFLYPLLSCDREATVAIFDIIKQQPGY